MSEGSGNGLTQEVKSGSIQAAWIDSANGLTSWALTHLLVRRDAYGRHTPVEKRGTPGREGEPIGKNYTANRELTANVVRRHFAATKAENVIGLLTIGSENTCLSVTIDIDHHGEPSPEIEERNKQFAITKYQALRQLGFNPLLTDSNGRGGFHLRLLFAKPILSQVAFAFGKWLTQDWQAAGLTTEPESFPKRKDRHSEKGQGGGWVRLPGRHHTREVWATVFDGETWHAGAFAVEQILSHTGDDPALIPDEAKSVTPPKVNGHTPPHQHRDHAHLERDKIIDRAAKYQAKMPPAISGQGGQDVTFHAACELFRFGLTDSEARDVFADFNSRCEPPWNDKDIDRKLGDARDAVITAGEFGCRLTNNRAPSPTRSTNHQPAGEQPEPTDEQHDDEPADDVADDAWTSLRQAKGRTERSNSRRFLKQFGDRVRFCHAWGKWLIWDGTRSKIDDGGAVMRLAMAMADSVWMDAKEHRTKDVVDFAVATSGHGKLNAMLKLAAADVPVAVDELDATPWLLNCSNGTVDLRTGELRPHRREDNLTKLCPTNYNPDAGSYCWDRFLEGVFDAPTIDFMQRFLGYCLTGDVSEQILAVFYGVGSNGKSTLLNAIQDTLGTDFSTAAPPSLLMEKKTETHPTELAGLFGKRLIIAQETNQGARLAESTVKQLTGGDIISARRMREDFWQFSPTHKLVLVTNHKPRVKGTDHAIWRRLVLIPFNNKFWNPDKGETGPTELRQDKTLSVKLKAEAEGILAWMVQGCLDWQRTGLQIPDSVRAATAEYRSEQDTLGRFAETCCIRSNAVRVKFSSLFNELEKWCSEGGDNVPSKRFVGSWLKDNGFKEASNNGRWYLGIALKAEFTDN